MLIWDQLTIDIGANICGCTMHKIMSDILDYGKYLTCMKGWLSDHIKTYR